MKSYDFWNCWAAERHTELADHICVAVMHDGCVAAIKEISAGNYWDLPIVFDIESDFDADEYAVFQHGKLHDHGRFLRTCLRAGNTFNLTLRNPVEERRKNEKLELELAQLAGMLEHMYYQMTKRNDV